MYTATPIQKKVIRTKEVPAINAAFSAYDRSGFLKLFKHWSWIILVLASILQCTFFPSFENLFANGCVLLGWKLTSMSILRIDKLHRFTLSSLLIIGFSLTQFLLPTVFTLTEAKPLIYNLKVPYQVFTHSLLALLVLLAAHHFYTENLSKYSSSRKKIQGVLYKFGLYSIPTDKQVWIIGFVGLASMFVSYFYNKQSYEMVAEGAGNKFLEGLIPYTYAPYFLLLKRIYTYNRSDRSSNKLSLLLFGISTIIIGMIGNQRGVFMAGFTMGFIGYFLALLLGKYNYRIFTLKNTILFCLAFWVITGPLADIATAMVVVRYKRGEISKMEMLNETLETFEDKEALDLYKEVAQEKISDWDERYFDNPFLARFCNLKFNDACLELANKVGTNPIMKNYSLERPLTSLPQPVLQYFQIDIDKEELLSYSNGDLLYSIGGGGTYALGTFRTGQFAGVGMASFGWWYLVLLFIGIYPVFYMIDLFVLSVSNCKKGINTTFISLAGLLSLTSIFQFLSLSTISENVVNIFTYMFRNWFQIVILYCLIFLFSRICIKIINSF